MRDVEFKARLVHERIDVSQAGPHRVNSKCTTPCLASHSVAQRSRPNYRSYALPGNVRAWCGAEQYRTVLGNCDARLGHGRLIGRRDLAFGAMCRRSMQIPSDAIFERILVDRSRVLPKWRGASICVPPWSGMGRTSRCFRAPFLIDKALRGLPHARMTGGC
jgi:hypothetical protein